MSRRMFVVPAAILVVVVVGMVRPSVADTEFLSPIPVQYQPPFVIHNH